jgi:hypothetical protein
MFPDDDHATLHPQGYLFPPGVTKQPRLAVFHMVQTMMGLRDR